MNIEELEKFLAKPQSGEVLGKRLEMPLTSRKGNRFGFLEEQERLSDERTFWMMRHSRLTELPEHGHDFFESMFVLHGAVNHIINQERITVSEGSILLLKPETVHKVERCGMEDIAISIVMGKQLFSPGFVSVISRLPEVGSFFQRQDKRVYLKLEFGKDSLAYQFGQRLLCSYFDPYYHSSLSCELLLELFLTEIDRMVPSPRRWSQGNIIDEIDDIARFIQLHYAEVTGEQLEERFGYTKSYISRSLKERYGDGVVRYRNRQRLLAAEQILLTTDIPVAEIACEVGVSSASNFYQMFVQEHHITPQEYRKRYKTTK